MLMVSFKFLTVALFSNQKSRLTWWIQSSTVLICSAHPPVWQNVSLSSCVTLSHPDMSNTYLVQTSDVWAHTVNQKKVITFFNVNIKKKKLELKIGSFKRYFSLFGGSKLHFSTVELELSLHLLLARFYLKKNQKK